MNRRQFLAISTSALAYHLLPPASGLAESTRSVVCEVEGTSAKAIQALFSSIGGLQKLTSVDPSIATILIKPNLSLPHQVELGTTSSPEVIDGLCEYLISMGARRIIIADHTLGESRDFKNIELNRVANKYREVKFMLANQRRLFQVIDVNGKVLKATEALRMLPKVDILINLATAKHHSATHVSLAIKNLMGLIWDRSEFHTRFDLSQAIADLAQRIRPSVNIIDASRILLSGGPTGPGPVLNENRLFASTDILALDAVVVSRYNFGGKSLSAEEISHLWASYKNGIGEIDIERIRIQQVQV